MTGRERQRRAQGGAATGGARRSRGQGRVCARARGGAGASGMRGVGPGTGQAGPAAGERRAHARVRAPRRRTAQRPKCWCGRRHRGHAAAPGRWLGRLGPACAGARVRTVEPWSGVRFGRGEAAAARWFGLRGCVSHGEGREEGRAPGAGARRGRAGQAELAWAHGRRAGRGRRVRVRAGRAVRSGEGSRPGGLGASGSEAGEGEGKEGGREKKKEKEKRGKRNEKKEKELEKKKMGERGKG